MYGFSGLWYFFFITLVFSGLVACSEMVKKKNPKLAESLANLDQGVGGYAGVATIVLAIIALIQVLGVLSAWLRWMPVSTILFLGAIAAGIVLGLLNGVDALKGWGLVKEEQAASIKNKLKGVAVPFGMIGIVSGMYWLIFLIAGGWAL